MFLTLLNEIYHYYYTIIIYNKKIVFTTRRKIYSNVYTWRKTRYWEEERENSRRSSREDGDEGVEGWMPESKSSTMCLTFF